jgi:hypothetical protein
MMYSFMLMFFIPNISIIMVFKIVFLSLIWSITFIWFMLIFTSLSFFIWSSKNLVKWALDALLWPSHNPPGIFDWTILKYVFLTIFPVYFITFWQFELMINFSYLWLLKLILWSLFFMFLWVTTFYTWLKRYESWNMINVNV